MSKINGFERKKMLNGDDNPKYIDLLDEDKAIAGQKFACVSFVTPDDLLKQKDLFFFQHFLKHWDFTKSVQKFTQFLNFLSFKYNLNFDKIMEDFQEYTKSEKDEVTYSTIRDDYKNFLDAKEDDLEKEFNSEVDFQTNTRGVKIRGCFPTQQEAELRAKLLREVDPNHDIGICPVGVWVPVNPEAYRTGRVEYLEEELNQLMQEKKTNETKAKHEFEKRVKEAKTNAIKENKKKAKASGNKLTQNVDMDGNLVGVGTTSIEETVNDTASSADIRKELFEGENVRTRTTEKIKKAATEKLERENMKVNISEKK
tara:strand:+ start:2233 stop:3171 length:939 start_codon:yes stop_codon:yes gene_type:complete